MLTITGLLLLGWPDSRLTWSATKYRCQQLNLFTSNMWYPPLTHINSATPNKSVTPGAASTAHVSYNGWVYLYLPSQFVSTCKLDLSRFPFDKQTCTLKFVSFDTNTTSAGVQFSTGNSSLSRALYSDTGEFSLTDASVAVGADQCITSCFGMFTVTLSYSRRPSYYLMTITFPAALLTSKLKIRRNFKMLFSEVKFWEQCL